DGCAGRFGQLCDRTDVVVVSVRDEDSGDRHPNPRDLEPEIGRIVSRVDDHRFGRAALRPDHVAIRPDRAELVPVDGERHFARESNEGPAGPSIPSPSTAAWPAA